MKFRKSQTKSLLTLAPGCTWQDLFQAIKIFSSKDMSQHMVRHHNGLCGVCSAVNLKYKISLKKSYWHRIGDGEKKKYNIDIRSHITLVLSRRTRSATPTSWRPSAGSWVSAWASASSAWPNGFTTSENFSTTTANPEFQTKPSTCQML